MILTAVAAVSRSGALGADGRMLWHLPEDFKHFKRTTTGHTLIMGRKTYEAIGKALPDRRTIVVTRDEGWRADDAEVAHDADEALALAAPASDEEVFVGGGGEIYALLLDRTDRLLLTEIEIDVEGDAYFPEWDRSAFTEVSREHHPAHGDQPAFDIVRYDRVR